MLRLFTALSLPEDVRGWLSTLRGGLKGARWIDAENFHITLRFIGDVDERTADEAADALGRIERAPLTIRLCGLDAFGNRRQPLSVWARVVPTPELSELQAEQERILQRIGLPAEARRFTPHVTIARLRGASSTEAAAWLAARGGFEMPPFVVRSFELMSSKSSVGGGPYLIEERYPLRLAQAA